MELNARIFHFLFFFLEKGAFWGGSRAKCGGCCTGAARPSRERHAGLDHRLEVCGGVVPSAALRRGLQSITNNRRQLATRAHTPTSVGGAAGRGVGESKVEQPSQSWKDATYAGSFKKPH